MNALMILLKICICNNYLYIRIFDNCILYNTLDTEIGQTGVTMKKYLTGRLTEFDKFLEDKTLATDQFKHFDYK